MHVNTDTETQKKTKQNHNQSSRRAHPSIPTEFSEHPDIQVTDFPEE